MKKRTKKPKGGSPLAESTPSPWGSLLVCVSTQETCDFYDLTNLAEQTAERIKSLHGCVGNTVDCDEEADDLISDWLFPFLANYEPIDMTKGEPIVYHGAIVWIGFVL